jgi:hypothetical protein
MAAVKNPHDLTGVQKFGILVFLVLCAFPALELNKFGVGIDMSLETALICSAVGGAIGGVLMCSRPFMAGLIGGLIAGPLGLTAVYFYTQHRAQVWHLELIIVQGIASMPGLAVGYWLKKFLSDPPAELEQTNDLSQPR